MSHTNSPIPTQGHLLTGLGKKHLLEKGEIACTSNFFFPTMFSTLSKTEIIIFVTFNLSSANAFNLVWSKILSCGNGLTPRHAEPLVSEKLTLFTNTLSENFMFHCKSCKIHHCIPCPVLAQSKQLSTEHKISR